MEIKKGKLKFSFFPYLIPFFSPPKSSHTPPLPILLSTFDTLTLCEQSTQIFVTMTKKSQLNAKEQDRLNFLTFQKWNSNYYMHLELNTYHDSERGFSLLLLAHIHTHHNPHIRALCVLINFFSMLIQQILELLKNVR